MIRINVPLEEKVIRNLKVGQEVLLSGVIYTARDQAHKRLLETIKLKRKLPLELRGAVIYYCGPTKTPRGKVIGSCGPTTSSRMDKFTPVLLNAGLKGMIGKGSRSKEVVDVLKRSKGVYFLAYAGCGALISRYIKSAKIIAYKDLGPEAILRIKVNDFPLIVAVDSKGNNIYKNIS